MDSSRNETLNAPQALLNRARSIIRADAQEARALRSRERHRQSGTRVGASARERHVREGDRALRSIHDGMLILSLLKSDRPLCRTCYRAGIEARECTRYVADSGTRTAVSDCFHSRRRLHP